MEHGFDIGIDIGIREKREGKNEIKRALKFRSNPLFF